jgi:hypothetical protein
VRPRSLALGISFRRAALDARAAAFEDRTRAGAPVATLLLALSCALSLAACGAGTAAIASASGSNGGSSNSPTQIVSVRVDPASARVAPALVRFNLVDPESDPAQVEVRYSADGTFAGSVVLAAMPAAASAPGAGVEHEVEWDFEPVFGAGLTEDVLVLVVLAGQSNVDLGVNAVLTALGNDAPAAELVAGQFPEPPDEASGTLPVDFVVSDSSSDDVRVQLQFGAPAPTGTLWNNARPAGLAESEPTPEFAFDIVTAFKAGSKLTFAWDSEHDLAGQDVAVELRIRAEELLEPKASSAFAFSPQFRVDNNVPPQIGLDVLAFALNPDRRRGIPLPFGVNDPESDGVQVLLQWTTESGSFPALPEEPDELLELLESEELRREKQIATEAPRIFEGNVLEVSGSSWVRLPELASTAAPLLSRSADPIASLQGRELELLRRSRMPAAASPSWNGSAPLTRPAAVLATDGPDLYVLDEPTVGQWRLRLLDPATGLASEAIGGLNVGTPTAMARVPGQSSLVVASHVTGTWRLTRVEPGTGAVATLFVASSPLELGAVRGLAVLRSDRSLVSVGDALVSVHHPQAPAQASARPVFDPGALPPALLEPHGLAPDPQDPQRVFVAENGRDRVVAVDLAELSITPLRAGPVGLVRPTALAFDTSGRRLFVMTDELPSNATRELWQIKLGLRRDVPGASQIERVRVSGALPATATGLATGPVALIAFVDPGPGELYVGGGIEQVRRIEGYDPARQGVSVEAPFQPAVQTGDPWRIVDRVANAADATVLEGGVFVWDARDVPGSVDVEVRAVAFDGDLGPFASGAAKSILGALDSAPEQATVCCVPDVGELFAPADLEGDGDIDLSAAQQSLLLSAPLEYDAVVNSIPEPEVVADLDQDGAQDLAAGGSIYYQIGGSPGSFQAPQSIAPVGFSDAGDVDRDGRLDLLCEDGSIYYHSAAGVFSLGPGVSLTGLSLAFEPKLGDMNGDGKLDVLAVIDTSSPLTHAIAPFVQSDQGTFESSRPIDLPFTWDPQLPGVSEFLARDIDLDGRCDCMVAIEQPFGLESGPACTWMSSTSKWTEILTPLGSQGSDALVLADLDGNGLEDLVVRQTQLVSIYYQTSPSHLAIDQSQPLTSPPGGTGLSGEDLDGDGLLDLGTDSTQAESVDIAVSRSPGGFEDPQPIVLVGPSEGYGQPAVGDFDHDGDLDLLAPFEVPIDMIHLFKQVRPGKFEGEPELLIHPEDQSYRSAQAADLDGDGRTDVALAGRSPVAPLFAVFVQSQGELVPKTGADWGNGVLQLELTDLDGDGPLDLVLRPYVTGALELHASDGSSGSTLKLVFGDPDGGRFCVVDFDRDGDYDVLEETSTGVVLNEQVSKEPLGFSTTIVAASGGSPLLAGDLDRDGLVDFVTGGAQLAVHLAQAGGGHALSQTLPIAAIVAHALDVDGDSFADLIVQDGSGTHTLIQILPGIFVENARLAEPGLGAERFADVDGDGELDAVHASSAGLRIQFGGR